MEKQLILGAGNRQDLPGISYSKKIRKYSETKLMEFIKGRQETTERAPKGYLKSKISNIVLYYNSRGKVNHYEP